MRIDTTGTKKVWIQIKQSALDNGEYNKEDGSGIAVLESGDTVPEYNALLLATIQDGVISDARVQIPKIQHLQTQLNDQQDSLSEVQSQVTELMSN